MTKQENSIKIIVNNKGLYSKHYMKTKTVFYKFKTDLQFMSTIQPWTWETRN